MSLSKKLSILTPGSCLSAETRTWDERGKNVYKINGLTEKVRERLRHPIWTNLESIINAIHECS